MPSGPGVISLDKIREIVKAIPSHISIFLLTSSSNGDEINQQIDHTAATHGQLVNSVDIETYRTIKRKFPKVKLVQVIHVIDVSSCEEAMRLSKHVDYILLDSGNPSLAVKELGGTGRVHNWKISQEIVKKVEVPVFLAGGLNENNVKQAAEEVMPYGVDLCSGVRTNGMLDDRKLIRFMKEISTVTRTETDD